MTAVGLSACQPTTPDQSFTPAITVYAEKPARLPVAAAGNVSAPPGMIYVPGGLTRIGAEDGQEWEKPLFWAEIKPFFMDEHPVTVGEFRVFLSATHYQTEADATGEGTVFDETSRQWALVKNANWEYPQGKTTRQPVPGNHPVTQVSWNDAVAYATWAGKRLPLEIEWEHAARNAVNSRTRYPFGDALQDSLGHYLANTWNGTFPDKDAVSDGFHLTSPVGYYGKTPLGLTDMTGNVWQWCADWRQSYADLLVGKSADNPTEKAERGGSFLCESGWCHGYRVSGRSFSTPETALMHVGFRCVRDM